MAAPDESSPLPARRRGRRGARRLVLVVEGQMTRAAVSRLCTRVRVLLDDDDVGDIVCDVGSVTAPDLATIDALARLLLAARRRGSRLELRHACDELLDLVELAGLRDELPVDARDESG